MHIVPDQWLPAEAKRDQQSVQRDSAAAEEQQIGGVFLRPLPPVATGYGHLSEILRSEWLGANKVIDQVFASTMAPGYLSAWHAHEFVTDRLYAVIGTVLAVLYDCREDSPTRGTVQQFTLDSAAPALLIVPPKIWHGIKNIGTGDVCLVNAVDIAYRYERPDHWRISPESDVIPYRF